MPAELEPSEALSVGPERRSPERVVERQRLREVLRRHERPHIVNGQVGHEGHLTARPERLLPSSRRPEISTISKVRNKVRMPHPLFKMACMTTAADFSLTLPSADAIAGMEGAELDHALLEAELLTRRLEAFRARIVNRAEAANRPIDDGHRSVRGWMMAVTNCSPSEARTRHNTARLTRAWGEFAQKFEEGRIGCPQVRELARLSANPRCGDQLPASGAPLLDAARELQYCDFRIVARRWEQLADADGAHREHEASVARRNVQITEIGGEFEIRGRLPVIQGTIVRDIFEHFVHAEFLADTERAREEHGVANSSTMSRTGAQRRADAFVTLFHTAAGAGVNGTPIEVCVNLLMGEEQFQQYLRNELDDTPVDIDPATVRDQRCETTDGVPVDPRQAMAVALTGQVRRIVVDAQGVITDAGQKRRFTSVLRDVLRAIDPRCRWLGCMIRAAVAELDHRQDHSRGGPTSSANADVVCKHHNLFKYRNGYQPVREPSGAWYIERPDGSRIQPPDAA